MYVSLVADYSRTEQHAYHPFVHDGIGKRYSNNT
jgi:hypothetical protein